MSEIEFWKLIDTTRVHDPYQHVDRLVEVLSEKELNEIVDFDYRWCVVRNRGYLSRVWIAISLVSQRFILDDEFLDFVGWLILQGRSEFERIVADPDRMADSDTLATNFVEGYPARLAWRIATDAPTYTQGCERFFSVAEERYGTYYAVPELDEPLWYDDEEQIRRRLPMIAARFGQHVSTPED